jgi:hypothetical protein
MGRIVLASMFVVAACLLIWSGIPKVEAQASCYSMCCEYGIDCPLACCLPSPNQADCQQPPCPNYCGPDCGV